MYHNFEKKERANRQQALWLAIFLHLGLAAALYLSTSDSPASSKVKNVNTAPERQTVPVKAASLSTP
jgi:hypothetical protein